MISPTVARMVWFYHSAADKTAGVQPHPAVVTYVHSDTVINVAGWHPNGTPFSATNLALVQDGPPPDHIPFAEWMPYQKGQAAKTEEAEKAAFAASVDKHAAKTVPPVRPVPSAAIPSKVTPIKQKDKTSG